MNFFMEVAKLRAARQLWAGLVKGFNPKSDKSLPLRAHSQTSGWSLTAQDPFNNIVRTQIEAMAATQGHTQSLHTNALDEALALPTPFSARIARNTQLFLIEESGTTRVIDPWGGSYYVERLTADLAARARSHIDEIEMLGGMARAIELGVPKRRIEEAAARTQARIDSGRQTVIGVNAYPPTVERELNVLKVDAAAVRAMQIEKLKRLRAERDEAATRAALEALTAGARGDANLLLLSIEAARAKATVGEISLAMEKVFGRHVAEIHAISGVYLAESGRGAEANEQVLAMTRAFAENEGRAPCILVAKMGQDGHDRGQKIIASAFADLGFDVKIGPLFATPEEVASLAADAQVHIVGVSSLAAGHLALVPALKIALAGAGMGETIIAVGGVIPAQDFAPLRAAGAEAIFPPGTIITEAAQRLIERLNERRGYSSARPRVRSSLRRFAGHLPRSLNSHNGAREFAPPLAPLREDVAAPAPNRDGFRRTPTAPDLRRLPRGCRRWRGCEQRRRRLDRRDRATDDPARPTDVVGRRSRVAGRARSIDEDSCRPRRSLAGRS